MYGSGVIGVVFGVKGLVAFIRLQKRTKTLKEEGAGGEVSKEE